MIRVEIRYLHLVDPSKNNPRKKLEDCIFSSSDVSERVIGEIRRGQSLERDIGGRRLIQTYFDPRLLNQQLTLEVRTGENKAYDDKKF